MNFDQRALVENFNAAFAYYWIRLMQAGTIFTIQLGKWSADGLLDK